VARYIEQNPKRARIVKNPEDYPYSSALAHIKGVKDNLLTEELFDENEREEYLKVIKGEAKETETDLIRKSTKTGKPLGDTHRHFIIYWKSEGFIKRIAELLKVDFITKKTCKRVK
jgi:hypothetical protein